ncbi:MAG: 2-amino-4-hydroxy-6-hydroxymethyldihydropteridine diphosphokinase [Bacteroidota bacterium]
MGLGSNMGDLALNLSVACQHIEKWIGPITNSSSCIETKAWGIEAQNDFLNQVIVIETSYTAFEVLAKIQEIEHEMGRERIIKWGPRLIDIDILFFNDEIWEAPDLVVPHPYMAQRAFILNSLVEIAPNKIHPILHKSMKTLLEELTAQ